MINRFALSFLCIIDRNEIYGVTGLYILLIIYPRVLWYNIYTALSTYLKIHSSRERRHFVTPSRAIQRQGFQLRQTGLAVTDETALRVVRASFHSYQTGRIRFPLRAEMHGRGHNTDSCFIAFITSKIC